MYRCLVLACVTTAWLGRAPAAEEQRANTIDLGGPRQVRATLSASETEYVIQVRMLPVRCFDAAMNSRLNREKGLHLARQALAKHLSAKETVYLRVSEALAGEPGTDGKFYTLKVRIPRRGVTLLESELEQPATQKPTAKEDSKRPIFTSGLLTRKRDYLNTIDHLSAILASDLKTAGKKIGSTKDESQRFFIAIAELEERCESNLKKLGKEIEADLLLLSVEKEELLEGIKRQQAESLEVLKEAVRKWEIEESKGASP